MNFKPLLTFKDYRAVFGGIAAIITLLFTCSGCRPQGAETRVAKVEKPTPPSPPTTEADKKQTLPVYTYDVVRVFPHDPKAFTQGLVFQNGILWESTGLNGQSSLRKVELESGKVLQQLDVPPEFFGEGLALLDGKAFQLTWRNHKGFVYDMAGFKLERDFAYEGEGWGLTTDGALLILSDGTDTIRFLDPKTFAVTRSVRVQFADEQVERLNELEFIDGQIFANVWGEDFVLRIDPVSGKVTGLIDFRGLLDPKDRVPGTDVLNGIAYDAATQRIFVTGKRWPKLFEVKLKLK